MVVIQSISSRFVEMLLSSDNAQFCLTWRLVASATRKLMPDSLYQMNTCEWSFEAYE